MSSPTSRREKWIRGTLAERAVIDSDRAMLVWEHKRVVPSHAVLVEVIVGVGVIVSAIVVALGAPIADPIIGLVITALILHITWHIWNAVRGHHH